uniref:hypothetical protein n=1 Tax=Desulfonatronospira sp. TaxID=1962951 RepID=UPI0025C2810C
MAGSKNLDIAEEIAARRKKAEKIAANHKIADVNEINEITNVLTCAVMALKDMRGKNNKPLSEKRILEIVAGHLDEALKYLEPERAFSMFSSSDVKKLVTVYIPYYNALTSKETPFYTREELAEVIQDFYRYLFSNKNFLLLCGYPRRSFEKSPYFDRLLSNLYPVKIQKPPEQGW